MPDLSGLKQKPTPDFEAFLRNIARKGTPDRAHNIELFHDGEVIAAIGERFDLGRDLDPNDPFYNYKLKLAVLRFLNFDYVYVQPERLNWALHDTGIADTAGDLSRGTRYFMEEHRGPITTWEEFEKFPWPDPHRPDAMAPFEWYEKNLPDDMCVVATGVGSFCEYLCWLPAYESLCFLLYDNRELVKAIADRVFEFYRVVSERELQFERVKVVFTSDDMGFKGGTLISPADIREFCLPGQTMVAKMAHDAGRLCILHSCGKLDDIWDDIIDDCKMDGKHSFEDTIEDVRDLKKTYGKRITLLGGIDVDFLCRSDEAAIRNRVRSTLDICSEGGGYLLGTGNSVANYIPLDNYLVMVDEGRRWRR